MRNYSSRFAVLVLVPQHLNQPGMKSRLFPGLLIIVTSFLFSTSLQAQQVQEPKNGPASWSNAYPSFRIAGNLYYVGTEDLASYLITTPKGHILINTGLASSGKQIEANIRKLGVDFKQIKILLTTQAHYDHMGAMAEIQQKTGAKFWVNAPDSGVVADGGLSDYALSDGHPTFRPVRIDSLLNDGDRISLGGTTLQLLHHPGHTRGSCSFLFTTSDSSRSYQVLIANFPTIVTDKKFSEVTTYPQIEKDLTYTLAAMPALSFDIWVASHASQFDLQEKRRKSPGYAPLSFADRAGYDRRLRELKQDFDQHPR